MKLRLDGKKCIYKLKCIKNEDGFNISLPKYSIRQNSLLYIDGKWIDCDFYFEDKRIVYILTFIMPSNKVSEVGGGAVNGFNVKCKLTRFKYLLIVLYGLFFRCKIAILKFRDRLLPIKKNLLLMLLAFMGSVVYFLINHYFDKSLQKLINDSNLVQSIIVLLSLSSIINIFHPFTIHKEIEISDVQNSIKKNNSNLKVDLEKEQRKKRMSR